MVCRIMSLKKLKSLDSTTIMVKLNRETDYEMSDIVFFEELTFETLMSIYEFEQPKGILLSIKGQATNNKAIDLHREKV